METSILTVTSPEPELLRQIACVWVEAWRAQATEADIGKCVAVFERWLGECGADCQCLLVAVRLGNVVGVARARQDAHDPAAWWLMGVAVDRRHRRQGIAHMLGEARIAHARQRGARVMRSETTPDNLVSIRYHESLGFSNAGSFTALDGERKVAFVLGVDPHSSS